MPVDGQSRYFGALFIEPASSHSFVEPVRANSSFSDDPLSPRQPQRHEKYTTK
jgi:hypothetical protein